MYHEQWFRIVLNCYFENCLSPWYHLHGSLDANYPATITHAEVIISRASPCLPSFNSATSILNMSSSSLPFPSLVTPQIFSRLVHCNYFLSDLSVSPVSNFQHRRNNSARVIIRKIKSHRTTCVGRSSHWLPVSEKPMQKWIPCISTARSLLSAMLGSLARACFVLPLIV